MAEKIILKHTSVENKRPGPEYMVPGELALNLSTETPGLFFKDESGAIRKVGPAVISNNPPNQVTPGRETADVSIGEMWINPLANYSISIWTGAGWEPAGAVGFVSDAPPAEPNNGQLWFDTVERELKTYYAEEDNWVGYKENATGISIANAIVLGTGNSPYEIFVDPINGTDAFINDGTDQRRPFRTLNRALIEAARRSIRRGGVNDEFDRILIRCRNGDNIVYNGFGTSLNNINLARVWGPEDSEGSLALDYNRFIDGANLLIGNRDWIVSRAYNALAQAFTIDFPNSLELKEKASTIKKLLSGIIDAIALDLRANGNANTLRYAKSFYNGDGVLIAFDNVNIKNLFIEVALPVMADRAMLALQNRGALQDDTISLDTSANGVVEDLCSNVQQAVMTYLSIVEKTLTGSLDLSIQSNPGNFPTEPTQFQLQAFNDPEIGGLIIPRGVSIQGADLRKTNVIPSFVPTDSQEGSSIFRFTGGSFFFNFTFKDNPNIERSHHLLSCFTYATDEQLDLFYKKVAKAFGLDDGDTEVRVPEYNIVFTEPDIDTTFGSSPYVFNCSVRSNYGLSGIEADGELVGGLKSVVTAQFTNVSLQRDPEAWEIYDGGDKVWRSARNYDEVIATPVENVRYKERYRHFAFRAKNGAYMQIVSCFVIGNAVHYWSQTGGDLSITNSTSNFGGTSCIAEGFAGQGTAAGALAQDSDFAVERIVRPLRLPITAGENPAANARRILVGVFNTFDDQPSYVDLVLEENFRMSSIGGFELEPGSRLYFTDLAGVERSLILSSTDPFPLQSPTDPDDKGNVLRLNPATDTTGWDGNQGREVYIKRFFDFRGAADRAYKLRVRTTKTGTRRPQINFIFRLISGGTVGQVQVIESGVQLDDIVSGSRNNVFYIANVEDVPASETETEFDTFDLTILSLDSFTEYSSSTLYALGDVVIFEDKLYRSLQPLNQDQTPNTSKFWWEQIRFQQDGPDGTPMEAIYAAVRQKLDKDDGTVTMGLTREDYDSKSQNFTLRSVDRFLEILGYNLGTRSSVLQPQAESSRLYDPTLLPNPDGGAALRSNNWPVEFNRPSLIRASGHTWEWAGYYNYSKAIPNRQNSILSPGNRESSLAIELFGGRVYANGLTEEGELFENGRIIPRQSLVDQAPDFDPVNTGIVSRLANLQIGSCESPEPGASWLSTDNLKVCQDMAFGPNATIRDRFALPQGLRASFGNGTLGTPAGIQYGFARPATMDEAMSGINNEGFLTSVLLKEASKAEIGKISFFASSRVPYQNYLVCDGSSVPKAAYPRLYNYLRGRDYDTPLTDTAGVSPYGEDANTFALPDLRGRFPRGWSGAGTNESNGLDTGRSVGTYQTDSLGSHNHQLNDPGHSHWAGVYDRIEEGAPDGESTSWFNYGTELDPSYTNANSSGGHQRTSFSTTGATVESSGGSETRPHNISLLPCIRYQ